MPRRLSTHAESWIEDAVSKHSQDENILWEIGLTETPEGPGYLLAIWLPGPILGQAIHGQIGITHPNLLNAEQADQIVGAVLEQLRAARSQALASVPSVIPDTTGPTNGQILKP